MLELRAAKIGDAPEIERVARAAWADAYAGLIPEAAQAAFLDQAYNQAALEQAIQRRATWFFVAENEGRLIGYAEFGPIDPETVELFRIYVDPDEQRSGAGSALLDAGLLAIRDSGMGYRRLVLRAEEGNAKAAGFYRKHGFTEQPAEALEIAGSACCALQFERRLE